jgi:hypothetical protein
LLTRFPQRYYSGDAQRLAGNATMAFGGQVMLAPASGQLAAELPRVSRTGNFR